MSWSPRIGGSTGRFGSGSRMRARGGYIPVMVGLAIAVAVPAHAQTPGLPGDTEARAALYRGDYEGALDGFRAAIRANPNASDYRGLIETLVETGEFADAEEIAGEGIDAGFRDAMLQPLGLILYRTGRRSEGEALLAEAAAGSGPDRNTARYWRGVAMFERGDVDGAYAVFDSFIDLYNAGPRLNSKELEAVGLAVKRMGRRDQVLFQDAVKAFDRAIEADPTNHSVRVHLAELFLEKYDAPEASLALEAVFRTNARHPDALLVGAKLARFEQRPGVEAGVQQALETNPNHIDAKVFRATLLLEAEAVEAAAEIAGEALEVNPTSLPALSLVGAAAYLGGDEAEYRRIRDEVATLNPAYNGLLVHVAESAVRVRRYADAVALADEAVEIDPRDWSAMGLLGINRLRIGQIEQGRADLERAFEGDPYNLWFKNTLDLLDTFDYFVEVETEHFILAIREDEVDLLEPIVAEVAERAWDALVARYGIEPPTPIRIELFPSSADFSVRTVGLTGMGALGVSFGNVVAIDSPSARERGDFSWASVLWHELAHSFHLAASDHRVPRWFTEGLAVHDQRQAEPAWGHDPSVSFLMAWRDDRLPPPSDLNSGFVRPSYPEQLVHSYYQASLVFQMIEEEWGMEAIRDLVTGFSDGPETNAHLQAVLGITPEELDERFERFMLEQFGRLGPALAATEGITVNPIPTLSDYQRLVAANPDHYPSLVGLSRALIADGRRAEAREYMERALEIFPEDGDPMGPGWVLADMRRDDGDNEGAAEILEGVVAVNESHVDANIALGEVRLALGDTAAAVTALERAALIFPYDLDLQVRLAELAETVPDWAVAVEAREAVLALQPVDRAEALYRLANAQYRTGDATTARRTVLLALEIAPSFQDALSLLLEIRGGGGR